MRLKTPVLTAVCLLLSLSLLAQHEHSNMSEADMKKMMEAYQKATSPGDAHKALDSMVGTWDTVIRFWAAPGAPPQESTGIAENRWILGGRYVEQRFKGSAMGQPFEGLGYTGYDNMRKQYFGTWMDTMSTGMMSTTGRVEDGGKTWKFKGMMDDPVMNTSIPVDEVVKVLSPDKHVMEMWQPGPDGKSFKSMEITYTRKK
ncbi:MAG TPA: DUF1579 domain-containing protein [Thermoanaerobaculia bacterium]|nr:DUF1579 domain-containing protein [Thermoanaerobaculia bacterium]